MDGNRSINRWIYFYGTRKNSTPTTVSDIPDSSTKTFEKNNPSSFTNKVIKIYNMLCPIPFKPDFVFENSIRTAKLNLGQLTLFGYNMRDTIRSQKGTTID